MVLFVKMKYKVACPFDILNFSTAMLFAIGCAGGKFFLVESYMPLGSPTTGARMYEMECIKLDTLVLGEIDCKDFRNKLLQNKEKLDFPTFVICRNSSEGSS